jgi:co-chaperonin GroES (HSP10)
MQPIGKYIVIEQIKEKETVAEGKLILNGKFNNDIRYIKGRVLAVGTEVYNKIEVDSIILYDKHAGFVASIDNDLLLFIKEGDVVTIL